MTVCYSKFLKQISGISQFPVLYGVHIYVYIDIPCAVLANSTYRLPTNQGRKL